MARIFLVRQGFNDGVTVDDLQDLINQMRVYGASPDVLLVPEVDEDGTVELTARWAPS